MADQIGREAAIRCARRALSPTFMGHAAFEASLRSVTTHEEKIVRVLYEIERRTLVRQMKAAPDSRASAVSVPTAFDVDAWEESAVDIASRTRELCICPTCAGAKLIDCVSCKGSGRAACDGCRGSGRVAGKRGTKNCPSCRGRGDTKCRACKKGRVGCPRCAESGRVYTWFELRGERLHKVEVRDRPRATQLHGPAIRAEDFDAASWPHVCRRNEQLSKAKLGVLPSDLKTAVDPITERIQTALVQEFDVYVFRIVYSTRVGDGVVEIAGTPPSVVSIQRGPIYKVRAIALLSAMFAFIALSLVVGSYLGQHEWFERYGTGGPAGVLSFLACPLAAFATLFALRPKRAHTVANRATLLGLAAAVVGCFATLAAGSPSLAEARQALKRGDLDHSFSTLGALRLEGDDVPAIRKLEDEVQLARARQASTLPALVEIAGAPWGPGQERRVAIELLSERVERDAHAARTADDANHLSAIAQTVSALLPQQSKALAIEAAHMNASNCLRQADFTCAERGAQTLRELGAQREAAAIRDVVVEALQSGIVDHVAAAHELDDPVEASHLLELSESYVVRLRGLEVELDQESKLGLQRERQRTTKRLEQHNRLLETARRREEANVRRKQVREEARQRAEEARERRREAQEQWASAPLECCDGSHSPSCECGRGSYQGCCSHHGGVCGCSAD